VFDLLDKHNVEKYKGSLFFDAADSNLYYLSDNKEDKFNVRSLELSTEVVRQLTSFTHWNISKFTINKLGDMLLLADQNGNEEHKLWLKRNGEEPVFIAPNMGESCLQGILFSNGEKVIYSCIRKGSNKTRIVSMDLKSLEEISLFEYEGICVLGPLSKNEKVLPILVSKDYLQSTLYLINLDKGNIQTAEWSQQGHLLEIIDWSIDGTKLFFLSNQETNYISLYSWEIASHEPSLIKEFNWDIQNVFVSHEAIIFLLNEGGWGKFYLMNKNTLEIKSIFENFEGVIETAAISNNKQLIAAQVSTPNDPQKLLLFDLNINTIKELFFPKEKMEIEMEYMETNIIRNDGSKVPAFLYSPKNVQSKFPVIILLHGGPHSQSFPSYSPFIQTFINAGYGAIVPNFRGSTGYGRTYADSIIGDWGNYDLEDIEYTLKWLQEQKFLLHSKIGLFGISYGGFLAISALTRIEYDWAFGISYAGPTDLKMFVESLPKTSEKVAKTIIGDINYFDKLSARSPINILERLNSPLLVIQSENDVRVKTEQTENFITRAAELKKNVDYLLIENKGHQIYDLSNIQKELDYCFNFIRRKFSEI
jgi:dipeptidyl aminopeptidase/acylaminoacyl peptidase